MQVYLACDQEALHFSAPDNRVQHELLATVFQTIAGETNLSSSVMTRSFLRRVPCRMSSMLLYSFSNS
jgi:hypothetical protein